MDQNPQSDQFRDQSRAESTPKQSVVARVQQATNVLVTVRSNPSVDELSACIGLTLMLNRLGKHATAVFSGQVPSTLEFLKPEETIEQNTDSLRDFIVSLDKSKADKLRYKVEENVVKIFITPYRTSISEKDLEFTQGDFNVDVVLALGVTVREELDQAITAHGRILHDATVITITAGQHESTLGTINWQEPAASSLSEMLVSVSEAFQGGIIDEQMATAFLTGIVAETDRFSNTKTTPKVMTMAAQLMAAGANQQLIANELDKVIEVPIDQPTDVPQDVPAPEAAVNNDGSLTISHEGEEEKKPEDKPADTSDDDQRPEEKPDEDWNPERIASEQAGTGESFLPPLPDSGEAESFEPLVGGDAHDHQPAEEQSDGPAKDQASPETVFEPTEPLPPLEPDHTPDPNSQIHIDGEGNFIQRRPSVEPKHKVINPLPPAPEAENIVPAEPSLDEQLANLSNQLKENAEQPFENVEVSDVKATDPGTVLPETPVSVPEVDLPTLGGTQTEMSADTAAAPSFNLPTDSMPEPILPPPPVAPAPATPAPTEVPDSTTLLQIEEKVHSPHLEQAAAVPDMGVDDARNAVMDAISQAGYDAAHPEPRTDLNAQPLGTVPAPEPGASVSYELPPAPVLNGVDPSVPQPDDQQDSGTPPPPIPPPLMPMQ